MVVTMGYPHPSHVILAPSATISVSNKNQDFLQLIVISYLSPSLPLLPHFPSCFHTLQPVFHLMPHGNHVLQLRESHQTHLQQKMYYLILSTNSIINMMERNGIGEKYLLNIPSLKFLISPFVSLYHSLLPRCNSE
jgi:hypothetical protein